MRDRNEVLFTFMEECGEAIQAASKLGRFGPDNFHPDDPKHVTNREKLKQEIGDVLAMIEVLQKDTDLGITNQSLMEAKQRAVAGFV